METFLGEATVGEIVKQHGRVVEVPYTATVLDTLNEMLAKDVTSVPVAAPPGEWIGAGGSTIVELDEKTSAPRKQYIGIVTALDILMHFVEKIKDEEWALGMPIAAIIGHSLEGLSLWSMNPSTSVLELLEPMSKGVHRMLVPARESSAPASPAGDREGPASPASSVELAESATSFRMLTQTDVVRFLLKHAQDVDELLSKSVEQMGAVQTHVLGLSDDLMLMDALQVMQRSGLSAVPLVKRAPEDPEDPILVPVSGRRVVATLSASDLRGCNADVLKMLPSLTVADFLGRVVEAKRYGRSSSFGRGRPAEAPQTPESGAESEKPHADVHESVPRKPVTCRKSTPLKAVMESAVTNRIHRVWVTGDDDETLEGVATLSDILKGIRHACMGPTGGQVKL